VVEFLLLEAKFTYPWPSSLDAGSYLLLGQRISPCWAGHVRSGPIPHKCWVVFYSCGRVLGVWVDFLLVGATPSIAGRISLLVEPY
jgi:hypothetical protein